MLVIVAWVLQALANGYFIFFGAVLIGLWILYFCSTRHTWRTAPAILMACVLANLPLVPVMLKYHAVHEQYGLRRTMAEALWFSAPVDGWLQVSQVVWLWPKPGDRRRWKQARISPHDRNGAACGGILRALTG